jgi:hypothetical protein
MAEVPDDIVDDRLLAVRAVQVTMGKIVPLPHERQGLRGSQVEVARVALAEAGVGVLEVPAAVPRLHAHLDPAERLGQCVEPGQVHLGEVVDARDRSPAARPDHSLSPPPGLPPLGGRLPGGFPQGMIYRMILAAGRWLATTA